MKRLFSDSTDMVRIIFGLGTIDVWFQEYNTQISVSPNVNIGRVKITTVCGRDVSVANHVLKMPATLKEVKVKEDSAVIWSYKKTHRIRIDWKEDLLELRLLDRRVVRPLRCSIDRTKNITIESY